MSTTRSKKRRPYRRRVPNWSLIEATGARVRRLREKRKLTLEDAEDGTGIAPASLSLIERGRLNIKIDTLFRLAAWFDVPASKLVA